MDIYTKVTQPVDVLTPANAVSPPIFQTSVYAFNDVTAVDELLAGTREGYSYTRGGNPNTDALSGFVAHLENAEKGVITSSGTAALLAAIWTLQPRPGRIVVAREIYGGTVGLARNLLEPMGYVMEWVDTHNATDLAVHFASGPGVLVLETLSNPLGRIAPLDQIIRTAHDHGISVIIDNTFATPFHATPLHWGADLVVHSLTKFIGGHSDLILGAVVGDATTVARTQHIVDTAGFTPDPFAAWLALRGAKTLALRMTQSSRNAQALAEALETMPQVRATYYPGLPSHPDHPEAQRLLQRGFGSIVSMSLAGGYDAVQCLIKKLKIVRFVPSLGDVSTTLSHPVVASHRELAPEEKARIGIDESVVRISVGIESSQDIIEDFLSALA